MKGRIAQRFFYDRVKPSIRAAMEEYTTLTGREYDLIRCYRMENAEYAFIGLGSMMETARGAVDFLREKGMRIGVISVTSFRPFPGPEISAALRHCTRLRTSAPTSTSTAARSVSHCATVFWFQTHEAAILSCVLREACARVLVNSTLIIFFLILQFFPNAGKLSKVSAKKWDRT